MCAKASAPHLQVIERRESRARRAAPGRWPSTVISSAKGSVLRDVNGEVYLDFLAGGGALNYGHNDPDLQARLVGYLTGNGVVQGLELATESKAAFLATMERVVLRPRRMPHRMRFIDADRGGAVHAALDLARRATGRRDVIVFTCGLHADTDDWAGQADGGPAPRRRHGEHHVAPGLTVLTHAPYDGAFGEKVDTASMLAALLASASGELGPPAAILVETVQSSEGMRAASPRWMQQVAQIARRHGALLIVDDTRAGCGRAGTFFSTEPLGVEPDILLLGDSLSGYGLPMSVLLVTPDVDDKACGDQARGDREPASSARPGSSAAYVTATAALTKFWQHRADLEVAVARRSRLVAGRLTETAEQTPGACVRGRGMMQGLDVADPALAADVQRRCLGHGLLIERTGARREILAVMAPLTTDDALLDRGLEILHRSTVGAAAAQLVS